MEVFRATSTFLVPLSFGEFEIIVIPIALFFAMHRQGLFERCLGLTVAISGIVGIVVSGSRGGYVGFLASMAAFVAIWSIRKALSHRTSLAPALVGTMGSISSVIVFALILGRGPTKTYRFFEGMRQGCVVICNRLPPHWFYVGCPAIQIDDWGSLEAEVKALTADPQRLSDLYRETVAWWRTKSSEPRSAA